MNCLEKFIVELLQGNISVDGHVVEVRKEFLPDPKLPAITLDLSPGVSTQYLYHETDEYDAVYAYRNANININVWVNKETERELINNRILELFMLEKTNHYMFCTKYRDKSCNCRVKTIRNGNTVKNKCPNIDLYGYESLTHKHNIIEHSLNCELPYDMDEVTQHEKLLRSILRVSCDYYERTTPLMGTTYDETVFEE